RGSKLRARFGPLQDRFLDWSGLSHGDASLPPCCFILGPICLSILDVRTLPRLRPATDQDHQSRAIATEVNAVARAVINPSLHYALTHGLVIAKVTSPHP